MAISHEGETRLTLRGAFEAFDGETWLITGARREPARAARRPRRRRDSRAREELLPHRELHVRDRGGPGSPRRGRERARRRRSSASSRPIRSARPSTSASSSPAREATRPPCSRRCSSSERARTSLRRRTTRSSCSTGTWPRSTTRSAASCSEGSRPRSRARARCRTRARRARLRDDARPDEPPGRGHRPVPATDGRPRRGARRRSGPDPLGRGALGPRS